MMECEVWGSKNMDISRECNSVNVDKVYYFKNLTTKDNFLNIIVDGIASEITDESLAKKCVLLSLIGGNDAGRQNIKTKGEIPA